MQRFAGGSSRREHAHARACAVLAELRLADVPLGESVAPRAREFDSAGAELFGGQALTFEFDPAFEDGIFSFDDPLLPLFVVPNVIVCIISVVAMVLSVLVA